MRPDDPLDQVAAAYRGGRPLVVLLDYDGTLTPIVAHPRLAVLDPTVRVALARLARRPRVRLGVISGRTLAELKQLVALPEICLAGTAGLELEIDGRTVVHPRAEEHSTLIADLVRRLEAAVAPYPGAWIEDKRLACTVHYRAAAAQSIDAVRRCAGHVAGDCSGGLRLVEGPMAIEIAPDLGWNKGTAVELILDSLQPSGSPLVVYAGDSANDAEALRVVGSLGGVAIGVGPDAPPEAQFRLANQAAMAQFLLRLSAE